ncbi:MULTISPECIES: hypothetical protein [Falsihalocynthiibacter]|uniref:hypothetical protein n=1 Tax=Falsihalocynthiibacter TaxID=2854182 RepID=UPI00300124AC
MTVDFSAKKYPVVCRFEGLWTHQLAGYEMHRERKGGDLDHVDAERSASNKRLIGEVDWAESVKEEISEICVDNFANELDGLARRRRKSDIKKWMVEGPKAPWRNTKHGPMREVILTAHKDWFENDIADFSA